MSKGVGNRSGLSVLKTMAAKGIDQRHLLLLYQSVVLSVTDYRIGLTTMAQTNLLKLDRVQNEAMRDILGTTKDTLTETMRFMQDLPPVQTRQKVEQVKLYCTSVPSKIPTTHSTRPPTSANQTESGAGQIILHFSAVQNPHNPLHDAVKDTTGRRLGRGKSWVGQSED